MTPEPLHHLCLSHSPLTTMVFRATMAKLDLPAEQVSWMARRSVEAQGRAVQVDQLSDDLQTAFKKFQRARFRRLKSELHQHLERLTAGQRFIAYVPHTRQILYQEVINHPRCVGYYFLEEGFTSMAWESDWGKPPTLQKTAINHLRSLWAGTSFRSNRRMFDTAAANFRGAFAISNQAFRGMPGCVAVADRLPPYPSGHGRGRLYLVLDTCYLHRGIRWIDYEAALLDAVAKHPSLPGGIAVKFHFADADLDRHFQSLSEQLTARGFAQPERLAASFSLEDHLTLDDAVLFGVSSLGYYVSLFGGSARSFASTARGLDLDAWIQKGNLPADFKEISATVG
jgi:hypothetical protein